MLDYKTNLTSGILNSVLDVIVGFFFFSGAGAGAPLRVAGETENASAAAS